jgi:hypothetical protein
MLKPLFTVKMKLERGQPLKVRCGEQGSGRCLLSLDTLAGYYKPIDFIVTSIVHSILDDVRKRPFDS